MYELTIANRNYSSWSLRPWLLLTGLGVPFEERLLRFGDAAAWAAYRAVAPNGLVPGLRDGGTFVWDSLAITEYLAERHAGVWPDAGAARTFARCAAAEMHSGFGELRNACGMNCGLRVRLHAQSPALQANLVRLDALWQSGLDRFGGPFLAGPRFSAVDAFFAPVAFRVQTYGLPLGTAAAGYVRTLLELPGMQAWYRDALAEDFRDPPHEAEVAAYGTITADLRVPAAAA